MPAATRAASHLRVAPARAPLAGRPARAQRACELAAQRHEHSDGGGEHPGRHGQTRRSARSRLAASRPGTRRTGIRDWCANSTRSTPDRRAPARGRSPSAPRIKRVEQQRADCHPARRAVAAQFADQLAPQLRRYQHRVEREHEADERADRREQLRGLVGWRGCLGEQGAVEVGRLDVQPPGCQAHRAPRAPELRARARCARRFV